MTVQYLLDTNAASYVINKKSAAMDRHLAKVPVAELGISAVTEGELRYGAASKGSAFLETALENFLLMVSIFAWDSTAAREYGKLRAELEHEGQLLGSLDMMIGAHAISLGATLITGDRAFTRVKKLKIQDWTR